MNGTLVFVSAVFPLNIRVCDKACTATPISYAHLWIVLSHFEIIFQKKKTQPIEQLGGVGGISLMEEEPNWLTRL